MSDRTEPQGELAIRTLPMPSDLNAAGDVFGGYVMAQMDIAGSLMAYEIAGGRVATVAVDGMAFVAPVKVGDILCVYNCLRRRGRTSVTIGVEAWVRRRVIGEWTKVTHADFTYVHLDGTGRPAPLPEASS
ncbi:acyl-CoA thioesterase [Parvularcula dongshanensis]|uniref:Acyl-CoA thioesterase YciA n=1 Tax=Parvularcula dongshanensis TaxID=1173995 RepID=A0A840I1X7_9PROT|nr:acyl-CoA thioesterase [Parvularcula dongshanensis]MBB4658244.1 acyl-CoA thioesterase YciA [Parvularcula dongshanensis]